MKRRGFFKAALALVGLKALDVTQPDGVKKLTDIPVPGKDGHRNMIYIHYQIDGGEWKRQDYQWPAKE